MIHYINNILPQLKALKDPKDFFAIVTGVEKCQWKEVLETLVWFTEHYTDIKLKTHLFSDEKSFAPLEQFGWNYKWRDFSGNNFLHHAYVCMARNSARTPFFTNEALDYIASKVDSIYEPNEFGHHVLFNMLDIRQAGMDGHEFFEFIDAYPDFDYHQVGRDGKNLLFIAILKQTPDQIIKFLVEKGLALDISDKDNNNVLHMVEFSNSALLKKLFPQMLRQADLTQVNDCKESPWQAWMNGYLDVGMDSSVQSRQKARYWLLTSLEHIAKGDFKHDTQSLDRLADMMSQYQESFMSQLDNEFYLTDEEDTAKKKIKDLYNQALGYARYTRLDQAIPVKMGEKKKMKL